MKRLLSDEEIVMDGPEWSDGFMFYGEFFHVIIPDAELVFQTKIS